MSTDRPHVGRTEGTGDDAIDAEAWRDVGASVTAHEIDDVRWQLVEALHHAAETVRDGGTLTGADVDAIRRATDDLQRVTEEHLARLAAADEPWSRGAGMFVPYGVMRRHLDDDAFPPTYRTDADTDTDTEADTDGGEAGD